MIRKLRLRRMDSNHDSRIQSPGACAHAQRQLTSFRPLTRPRIVAESTNARGLRGTFAEARTTSTARLPSLPGAGTVARIVSGGSSSSMPATYGAAGPRFSIESVAFAHGVAA